MAKSASEDIAAEATPESVEPEAVESSPVVETQVESPAPVVSCITGCDFKDNYCQNCGRFNI